MAELKSVGLLVVNLYFYFFIGLQFRAGQSTMPCLHKALLVASNVEQQYSKTICKVIKVLSPC